MKFLNDIEDASRLVQDSTHRLVTDAEKAMWNDKASAAEAAESARAQTFTTNEAGRQSTFTTNEATRETNETARKAAEVARAATFGQWADTQADWAAAETARVNDFSGKADKTYTDTELAKKVDKVSGKGLSTEDYKAEDKAKVAETATEVSEARVSIIKNKTFANVRNRLEEIEASALQISYTMTNKVTNGNFANTSGWTTASNASTLTAVNNTLIATGKGTGVSNILYQQTSEVPVVGKKYYIRASVKVKDSMCSEIGLHLGDSTVGNPLAFLAASKTSPIQDTEYILSGVVTATTQAGFIRPYITAKYASSAINTGKIMEVKFVKILNLTDIFCGGISNTGKEPSISQVESVLQKYSNSWFDGSTILYRPKVTMNEIINLTNAFEINLYNSESAEVERIVDVANAKFVYLEISKIYDTSVRVYGLVGEEYVQISMNSVESGSQLNVAFTVGTYQIDARSFTSLKIMNKTSYETGSSVTAKIYTGDALPFAPIVKTSGRNLYSVNEATIDLIKTTPPVPQYLKNGKVYATKYVPGTGTTVYVSSVGDTADGTPYSLPTDVGQINQMRVLDNGNVILCDANGKVWLTDITFATVTLKITMANSCAVSKVFGMKEYEEKVMICSYRGDKNPPSNYEMWLSKDYGATFALAFNLSNYMIGATNYHIHDVAYDPYDDLYWICTGDGSLAPMIFYSKDAVTWYKTSLHGYAPLQSTQIIPLRNCVLFVGDARLIGVIRYNRPECGTKVGSRLHFDSAFWLEDGWGKDGLHGCPIASTAGIDFKNSKAYFGYQVSSDISLGSASGNLQYAEVFATDGYTFKIINKAVTKIVSGVNGCDYDNGKLLVRLYDIAGNTKILDVTNVFKVI